jgi:hypothetical protein
MNVGIYLAVIQFFFALSWTVYVIFLPQLAEQVGIPRNAVIYVLMLDQLIFVLADYAMGVASDRTARVVGRLGRIVLAVTVLSCAAFLLLPVVAPSGSAPLFLGLVVLWSITSSALRAPPLTLIGRHAATVFVIAAVLAAVAFQLHTALNSPRWYLRFVSPADLQWLAPSFWVGFNLALLPAGWAARRVDAWRVMAAAGVVAAAASLGAQQATALPQLVTAQLVTGAAWACLLLSGFSVALALGHTGREGRFSGALSSVLALAALGRLAVIAMEWQKAPAAQAALAWVPVLGWLLAGVLLFTLARPRSGVAVP